MPQERESQNPVVTPEEWDRIRQDLPPHIAAARALMTRKVTGIPRHPYLTGGSDHAPVLQGIAEFANEVYTLLDYLAEEATLDPSTQTAMNRVQQMMETPFDPASETIS